VGTAGILGDVEAKEGGANEARGPRKFEVGDFGREVHAEFFVWAVVGAGKAGIDVGIGGGGESKSNWRGGGGRHHFACRGYGRSWGGLGSELDLVDGLAVQVIGGRVEKIVVKVVESCGGDV